MYKINGKDVDAAQYGFDECHKFYIADTEEGRRQLVDLGYELFDMEQLPYDWVGSCPLRFISSGDLERTFVAQGEPATFEGWDLPEWVLEELSYMKKDYEDWE